MHYLTFWLSLESEGKKQKTFSLTAKHNHQYPSGWHSLHPVFHSSIHGHSTPQQSPSLKLFMGMLLAFRRNHLLLPRIAVLCVSLQFLLAPGQQMSIDIPNLLWQPKTCWQIPKHSLGGSVTTQLWGTLVPKFSLQCYAWTSLLLSDTHIVHYTLAQLASSSQSWEWGFIVSDHFSFSFKGKF